MARAARAGAAPAPSGRRGAARRNGKRPLRAIFAVSRIVFLLQGYQPLVVRPVSPCHLELEALCACRDIEDQWSVHREVRLHLLHEKMPFASSDHHHCNVSFDAVRIGISLVVQDLQHVRRQRSWFLVLVGDGNGEYLECAGSLRDGVRRAYGILRIDIAYSVSDGSDRDFFPQRSHQLLGCGLFVRYRLRCLGYQANYRRGVGSKLLLKDFHRYWSTAQGIAYFRPLCPSRQRAFVVIRQR